MRCDWRSINQPAWEKFLRHRDFVQLFGKDERKEGAVLEIGCGDGYLSGLLREKFSQAVALEPFPRDVVPGMVCAESSALPFKEECFCAVFSSNVLEHVTEIDKTLEQLKLVTADDTVMVHSMPTVFWKLMQLVLYPVYLFRLLLAKFTGRNPYAGKDGGARLRNIRHKTNPDGGSVGRASKLLPPVHGCAKGHLAELQAFTKTGWVRLFEKNGFVVEKTEPLFLHSAYRLLPFRLMWLREFLSSLGICSVRAYWVRKAVRES